MPRPKYRLYPVIEWSIIIQVLANRYTTNHFIIIQSRPEATTNTSRIGEGCEFRGLNGRLGLVGFEDFGSIEVPLIRVTVELEWCGG